MSLEPLWGLGHYYLGTCLATTGNAPEAVTRLERAIELGGRGVHNVAWLGLSHAVAIQRAEALGCLAEPDVMRRREATCCRGK